MTSICIKTFGCSLNQADSERMMASLMEYGYSISEDEANADLVVVNSCAVKGPTESNLFRLLKRLKEMDKKVVVAGCMAQSMPEKFAGYPLVGTDQVTRIGDVVYQALSGTAIQELVVENVNKARLPTVRHNPLVEIIPISTGCLDACTYCITKKARGNFMSYPLEDILARVRTAIADGVKEIFLTSPDNGCWGKDIGSNLPELVKAVSAIDGDHMIRVGMANPNHIIKFLPQLIEAFKHPRVYKFIHIPIQAGNDAVLKEMHRRYTTMQYRTIVDGFKKAIPQMSIATDIIVGYPTETTEQFEDTLRLIRETKPDVCNISRFWPRAHTPAAALKEIPGDEMKRRAIAAMKEFQTISTEHNNTWIGWQGEVLVTETGKGGTMVGKNFAYRQVVLREGEIGKRYTVRITKAGLYHIEGETVRDKISTISGSSAPTQI